MRWLPISACATGKPRCISSTMSIILLPNPTKTIIPRTVPGTPQLLRTLITQSAVLLQAIPTTFPNPTAYRLTATATELSSSTDSVISKRLPPPEKRLPLTSARLKLPRRPKQPVCRKPTAVFNPPRQLTCTLYRLRTAAQRAPTSPTSFSPSLFAQELSARYCIF